MKYFSMFSGIGGFELGIKRAFENEKVCRQPQCIGYSEIDKYATKIYEKNFPKHKNYGDATKIKARDLPDFDLLCGGFPCQAFSVAGKRRGFDDTRGTLFFDIARILKIKKPKIVLLENVKGLLNHEKGKTFTTILQTLAELGYRVEWMVLNSKFFGVPQNRERVFIIGHLRGECRSKVLSFSRSNKNASEEGSAVCKCLLNGYYKGSNGTHIKVGTWRTHKSGKGFREMKENISPTIPARAREDGSGQPVIRAVITPDRPNKRQNGRRFKEPGEPSFTLNTQDKHGVFNGEKIRRLTPKECERLQGFPDDWTQGISDTQRYKCLGNAVTVNVIEFIIRGLKNDM